MTPVRIRGEVCTTWQTLLAALELYVEEARPGEFSRWDVQRLVSAGEAIRSRILEEDRAKAEANREALK